MLFQVHSLVAWPLQYIMLQLLVRLANVSCYDKYRPLILSSIIKLASFPNCPMKQFSYGAQLQKEAFCVFIKKFFDHLVCVKNEGFIKLCHLSKHKTQRALDRNNRRGGDKEVLIFSLRILEMLLASHEPVDYIILTNSSTG